MRTISAKLKTNIFVSYYTIPPTVHRQNKESNIFHLTWTMTLESQSRQWCVFRVLFFPRVSMRRFFALVSSTLCKEKNTNSGKMLMDAHSADSRCQSCIFWTMSKNQLQSSEPICCRCQRISLAHGTNWSAQCSLLTSLWQSQPKKTGPVQYGKDTVPTVAGQILALQTQTPLATVTRIFSDYWPQKLAQSCNLNSRTWSRFSTHHFRVEETGCPSWICCDLEKQDHRNKAISHLCHNNCGECWKSCKRGFPLQWHPGVKVFSTVPPPNPTHPVG